MGGFAMLALHTRGGLVEVVTLTGSSWSQTPLCRPVFRAIAISRTASSDRDSEEEVTQSGFWLMAPTAQVTTLSKQGSLDGRATLGLVGPRRKPS